MAKLALAHYNGDELELDNIAYHLQQAIEKSLKFTLAENNIAWKFSHKIRDIYDYFVSNNLSYPDWIKNYWDELDDFESETRYGGDLVATRTIILEIYLKLKNI